MNKLKISLLVLGAIASILIVGCSKSEEGTDTATTATTAGASTAGATTAGEAKGDESKTTG